MRAGGDDGCVNVGASLWGSLNRTLARPGRIWRVFFCAGLSFSGADSPAER